MNPRRLLHTTAMRLALRYALFYAVLIALGLGVLYWATSRFVDAQIATGLAQELHDLNQVDQAQGRSHLEAQLQAQSSMDGNNHRYYLLDDIQSGKRLGNLLAWPPGLKTDGKVRNIWIEDDLIPGRGANRDGYWPMIAIALGDGSRLLVAQPVHQAEDLQEFTLATMAAIMAVSIGLALIMGWRLGRTLLERIDRLNDMAQKVTAGDLTRRAAVSGQDDEFDELAGHLNTMLARIETLMTGMRQVSDNIAHDLRRPLARMRNRIEVTLLEARERDEYRHAMEETLCDADELIRTFNALLEIAQAEAGSFRGEWESLDLSTLLQGLAELYQDQAESQNQVFTSEIEPDLHVTGNRHLLAQAISNLLENAFKYTGEKGTIRLEAKHVEGRVHVLVCDNGPGVPPGQRDTILHRFVRLEAARNSPGNGLGLSLVQAVADQHNAELLLEDAHPGLRVGLMFREEET